METSSQGDSLIARWFHQAISLPKDRWWDWPAVLLLLVLMQTAASRLIVTSWTPFLYLVQSLTFWGTVLGLALGFSRFGKGAVRWVAIGYTLVSLPWRLTAIIDEEVTLEEQLLSVGGRLLFSFREFYLHHPVDDPIFFVFLVSFAFWILTISAGYTLARHQNFLGSVLPAAVGILVIQNYDNYVTSRLGILGFFAFLALLLLGRLHYLENQETWHRRRVFISSENGLDLAGGMAIAAALIILLAWNIPASVSSMKTAVETWNHLTKPWRDFTDRMENAVSALESPSGGKRGEFFGAELPLGRGFPLSDIEMFSVRVPDLQGDATPPRYYWRGRVYDLYLNGQWYNTTTTRKDFSPRGDKIAIPDTAGLPTESFTFTTGQTTFSLIYAPSQPVKVSRPAEILLAPAGDGEDIAAWFASPALAAGETYRVDAAINNPSIQQLQQTGIDYPEWVTRKYLQLPEDFSPRIRDLAAQITRDSTTPFDKASAITLYLRQQIEYAPTVPEVPSNRDPLEWMLFDYRKGFCVYYATSEIVMLRSLGIPARMAVGFAQGEEDGHENTYIVRKQNAHAWPEVYFPNVGWVEFEPTGNQNPLFRPNVPVPASESQNADGLNIPLGEPGGPGGREANLEDEANVPVQPGRTVSPLLYWLPVLAALTLLMALLDRRYAIRALLPSLVRTTIERNGGEAPRWVLGWELWAVLTPVQRAFESINRGLRILGEQPPIHDTPLERAQALTKLLPEAAPSIQILLDEHQASLYTSKAGDISRARRAAWSIRVHTLRARVGKTLERIKFRFTG